MSIIGNIIADRIVKQKGEKRRESGYTYSSEEQLALDRREIYVEVQEQFLHALEAISAFPVHPQKPTIFETDRDNTKIKHKAAVEIALIKALIGLPASVLVSATAMVLKRAGKDPNEDAETDKICEIVKTSQEIIDIPMSGLGGTAYKKAFGRNAPKVFSEHYGLFNKIKEIKDGLFLVYYINDGIREMMLMNREGHVLSMIRLKKNMDKIKKSIEFVNQRNERNAAAQRLARLEKLK
ncbi:MAG: hypothetical protein IJQ90_03385 [Alphaproteobacteria bacterium]|nr:hypothetical protein [Alphaproteobacteria bacterium]